ncbi:unnamed protein product [Lampetra fluviatilis]
MGEREKGPGKGRAKVGQEKDEDLGRQGPSSEKPTLAFINGGTETVETMPRFLCRVQNTAGSSLRRFTSFLSPAAPHKASPWLLLPSQEVSPGTPIPVPLGEIALPFVPIAGLSWGGIVSSEIFTLAATPGHRTPFQCERAANPS